MSSIKRVGEEDLIQGESSRRYGGKVWMGSTLN